MSISSLKIRKKSLVLLVFAVIAQVYQVQSSEGQETGSSLTFPYAQRAMNYWRKALGSYEGPSLENAPLISGKFSDTSVPAKSSQPVAPSSEPAASVPSSQQAQQITPTPSQPSLPSPGPDVASTSTPSTSSEAVLPSSASQTPSSASVDPGTFIPMDTRATTPASQNVSSLSGTATQDVGSNMPPITLVPMAGATSGTGVVVSSTPVTPSGAGTAGGSWYQGITKSLKQMITPANTKDAGTFVPTDEEMADATVGKAIALGAATGFLGYGSYLLVVTNRINRYKRDYASIIDLFKYRDNPNQAPTWHPVERNTQALQKIIRKPNVSAFMATLEKNISSLTIGSWVSIYGTLRKEATNLQNGLIIIQQRINQLAYEALQQKIENSRRRPQQPPQQPPLLAPEQQLMQQNLLLQQQQLMQQQLQQQSSQAPNLGRAQPQQRQRQETAGGLTPADEAALRELEELDLQRRFKALTAPSPEELALQELELKRRLENL